jgi:predicted transcriptional regulator
MLPEEEAIKIAQLAIMFPEVQEELNRISESLEALGSVSAVTPSALVKLSGKLRMKNHRKKHQLLNCHG